MLTDNIDCGCSTRKETIGEETFWNLVIVGGALSAALVAKGGIVGKNTKGLLSIAIGGAILAVAVELLKQKIPGVK